ncbi:porin [Colwellia sp. 20A7]|uniref:porin n=1 Tax=Colwellia sp. 20A7 TaxID=2689569 RepID=UPI00135B4910|nr:porin [Colwellia sp. 20A7]
MKLVKGALSLMLCSVGIGSAYAANVDIYGRANVSLQSSDDGEGRYSELKSNASRIGFKGTHDLNDDLEVVYQAEFQIDIDGDSDDAFTARNQFIGLRGAFGEVLLGKNDSILKQSQGKTDLFSDLNGDIKTLWAGENRLSDTVTYKSPKFNGFQLGLTYIVEDSVEGEDALSIGAFYGDKNLKKSQVYAAIAYDAEVKGFDTIRATVQTKISDVIVGLVLQNQEDIATGAEMDGVMVSAKYTIGATTLKGQYQIADHKGSDKNSGLTAGADYKLASDTKLYAFYTTFDVKTENQDADYLGVGIQYDF